MTTEVQTQLQKVQISFIGFPYYITLTSHIHLPRDIVYDQLYRTKKDKFYCKFLDIVSWSKILFLFWPISTRIVLLKVEIY